MWKLYGYNIIFFILQPGVVTALLPYIIITKFEENTLAILSINLTIITGAIIFITGLNILCYCVILFARQGKGSLSPAVPTKMLVQSGLYKYSRNPMYIGVLLMLAGEAIYFRSLMLILYTAGIFLLFNAFIHWFEEPRLLKDFGLTYRDYCKNTRRWL